MIAIVFSGYQISFIIVRFVLRKVATEDGRVSEGLHNANNGGENNTSYFRTGRAASLLIGGTLAIGKRAAWHMCPLGPFSKTGRNDRPV